MRLQFSPCKNSFLMFAILTFIHGCNLSDHKRLSEFDPVKCLHLHHISEIHHILTAAHAPQRRRRQRCGPNLFFKNRPGACHHHGLFLTLDIGCDCRHNSRPFFLFFQFIHSTPPVTWRGWVPAGYFKAEYFHVFWAAAVPVWCTMPPGRQSDGAGSRWEGSLRQCILFGPRNRDLRKGPRIP